MAIAMDPRHVSWPELGLHLLPLDACDVYLLHSLLMLRLRALRCHGLEPMHGRELHRTDSGSALITHAPLIMRI